MQWHDAAQVLLAFYDGDVMNLYEAGGRSLRGENGILARLAVCKAYSDPVEKNSFLFTMFAHKCGAWQVHDLAYLKVAIDYHIMRIALRSGMIQVQDAELAHRLKEREPVSAEEDNLVQRGPRCLRPAHRALSAFSVRCGQYLVDDRSQLLFL